MPDAVAGDSADSDRSSGAVREGAIALENLAGVLRSPRVGARSLLKALPALQEGPQSLSSALDAVERDAAMRLAGAPGAAAVARVLSAARAQVDELAAGLAAVKNSFGARTRLSLEARARRTRLVIDATLDVAEAIAHAAMPQRALVDLSELFELRWPPADKGAAAVHERGARHGPASPLVISLDLDAAAVHVDARVSTTLVELAAHAVGRLGEVTVRFVPGARPALRVEAGGFDTTHKRLLAPSPLAIEAAELVRALAQLAGYELREEGASGAALASAPAAAPAGEQPERRAMVLGLALEPRVP